jgi:hypothetical protein
MIIYLKFAPCGQLVPKGEKMLFTKIELKEGEAQRGRKMLFTKLNPKGGELIKEGDQLKF